MGKEYVEMTKEELRKCIENMPDGTVVSIEIPTEKEDEQSR